MLDMIETALRMNGFLFQRIDGQKSLNQRARALDTFNNDSTCTVMLASIGSVAEGYDHTFHINNEQSLCANFSMR